MVQSRFLSQKGCAEHAEVGPISTQLMRLIVLILIGAIQWLEMKQQLIYLLDPGQTMQHLKDLALKFHSLLQSVQGSCPFSAVRV